MPTLPPLLHSDDPPTMEELKEGGLSGILPELILFSGCVL